MSKGEDHFGYEEDFHGKDRKADRKERKIVTARDRSKYKKSDQDQIKKRQNLLPQEEMGHLKRGRVLAITPEGVVVESEEQLFTCHLKGALKKEFGRMKNLVAVGDWVRILPSGADEGVIALVEERYSILSRADNLSRLKEQLIAVNIDQVLITASVLLPPLKPFLIDRYIIAAQKGHMEPLLVINKIDLLEAPPALFDSDTFAEEKKLYKECLKTYRDLGIPLFPVSSTTGEGIEDLKKAMHNKTSVFSGQSGVGKSSLINLVTGSSIRIGKVVERTSKGSHTTTTTHLLPIEGGGFCIDTPGIKSFGIWDLQKEEVQAYFSEIQEKSSLCRYPDCSHREEPDCAVKNAVENGEISSLRFASYCALMESVQEKHRHR